MTGVPPPDPPRPPAGRPDPEQVLAQALRAMAGGGTPGRPAAPPRATGAAPLTVLQIVLLALLIGLLVGVTAGLISLLA